MADDEHSAAPAWWLALGGGLLLWVYAAMVGGRTEAWDSPVYWQQAYPAGLLLCAWLGWRHPQRAWRWPMALMAVQVLALAFSAGSFGLLPLGLVVFALLSLPGIGLALLAARLARRRS